MGRVAAPHGVRGAFRVQPLSSEPSALLAHRQWWLRRPDGSDWHGYRLLKGREQSGALVVELEGIASRDDAVALRGMEVGVPRDALPALRNDEYYEADLVGMAVVNRAGETLGEVAGFAASGAHPIVRVVASDARERLIPWVSSYIDHVDADARRIEVDWPADF
jgi:16S rRNA processing protein RimM